MAEVLWNEDKEINGLYCPYQKKLFELYDHTIFLKKLRLFFFFFGQDIYCFREQCREGGCKGLI